ncbi:biliverdin-producing heme oxygenase [Rubinisphaera margarita]|uniref:biliverdin-producing heme oxygenase n=1 Tax=Rubinisphaera margarita TaxID=2909586 RepID=UPI001EE87B72|nr:biliverdin-producing heme oxygenase [Rubinisphaera margarita]MCG6156453.1 biliverdin-producing heme oxygenase [Rubinisphaera margarita]
MQLLEQFRGETHSSHQRLHQLINPDRLTSGLEEYVDGLQRYLSVVGPVEKHLTQLSERVLRADQLPPSWTRRLQKTSWLLEDLHCLKVAPRDVAVADFVPEGGDQEVQNSEQALAVIAGKSYALEGMTLGATRMAGLVEERLGLGTSSGCRFFVGYGEQTAEYWKAFRRWIEGLQIDDAVAVHAAVGMFRSFESGFSDSLETLESAGTDE